MPSAASISATAPATSGGRSWATFALLGQAPSSPSENPRPSAGLGPTSSPEAPATYMAAPRDVPESPEVGCTQMWSNGPCSAGREFATQFRAPLPAIVRSRSPVLSCSQPLRASRTASRRAWTLASSLACPRHHAAAFPGTFQVEKGTGDLPCLRLLNLSSSAAATVTPSTTRAAAGSWKTALMPSTRKAASSRGIALQTTGLVLPASFELLQGEWLSSAHEADGYVDGLTRTIRGDRHSSMRE
jgi:hypothetical protein